MNNVYLVGMLCSGKSTTGKVLAKRLGLKFVDTDDEIERLTGRKIKDIIEEDGNEMFIHLESFVLRNIVEDGYIVSTGGRTFLSDRNVDIIKKKRDLYFYK